MMIVLFQQLPNSARVEHFLSIFQSASTRFFLNPIRCFADDVNLQHAHSYDNLCHANINIVRDRSATNMSPDSDLEYLLFGWTLSVVLKLALQKHISLQIL